MSFGYNKREFLYHVNTYAKDDCFLLKNDESPISLQERACKETTYPKKREICEPIVLNKTSNNMQLRWRKWNARWWGR